MVSFECSSCTETIKKPKLKKHIETCASHRLTCIDCNNDFTAANVHAHTACITEAEKEKRKPKKATTPGESNADRTMRLSIKILPWHIQEASTMLKRNDSKRKPKLKMLTRNALHIAFLAELKSISKGKEAIIRKMANEANVEYRTE
ncbi:hypothetical protein XU18_1940 [Perkinsela sp. CCAP 1560/4]|nr:hypothetical protein XU18_1940 [Perkinsela sp. CCAP 1560/4]|eukprot:KNH07408.1 hypothetical protein XU18_1940 [Perkinsela sp. CCAP 1560/4]